MQLITTGINEEHQNSNQMKKICGPVRFTMYICVKYLKNIYIQMANVWQQQHKVW